MKFPGVISFRNDLPTWAIPKGGLRRASLGDVLEVDEDPLRRLRPEVDVRAGLLDRADARAEHQVELARLGQVAVGRLAGALARPLAAPHFLVLLVGEMVGAEAQLAGAAVDQRVGEAADVPGRLPDPRVEDDRRVERDDVLPLAHHRLEPAGLDVLLQQHAVVAVVVGGAEAAVDLRGGEDEASAASQRDDRVHRDGVGGLGLGHARQATFLPWRRLRPSRCSSARASRTVRTSGSPAGGRRRWSRDEDVRRAGRLVPPRHRARGLRRGGGRDRAAGRGRGAGRPHAARARLRRRQQREPPEGALRVHPDRPLRADARGLARAQSRVRARRRATCARFTSGGRSTPSSSTTRSST